MRKGGGLMMRFANIIHLTVAEIGTEVRSPVPHSGAPSNEPCCVSICQLDMRKLKCMAAISGVFSCSIFLLSSLGCIPSSLALCLSLGSD